MRCGSYFRTTLLAAALSVGSAGQAFAHARLISAAPAENSEVSPPPAVLKLSRDRRAGQKARSDRRTVDSDRRWQDLDCSYSGILPSGEYTVTCRALSADGHKTHGAFVFTVKP
jgi:methionine-rich copper-binding protein CopC